MFPNDDICNIKAAKKAAQRIFQKYSVDTRIQNSNNGLGQNEVKSLIKNAYGAININYNPSNEDVFSFMSVFGTTQDGKIELNRLQQLAVKYLCGQEEIIKQQTIKKQKPKQQISESLKRQKSIEHINLKIDQRLQLNNQQLSKNKIDDVSKNKNKINLQIKPVPQNNPNNNLSRSPTLFLSPKVNGSKNFFFSNQNHQKNYNDKFTNQTQQNNQNSSKKIQKSKKPTRSYVLNQANIIFNQARIKNNNSKIGITRNQAKQVLQKSYRLLGKLKYIAEQQDVQIWMKLCDQKKNGIIQWVNYQNFIKRLMDRQNIPIDDQN